MLKKAIIMLSLISGTTYAQIDSKQFVDCFEKAVNDVIIEIKENGGDTTRICDELSPETKDIYIGKFSEIENEQIRYYSASDMGQQRIIDLYDYMKDEMDCYGSKVKRSGDLFSALMNSKSYHRNLNLVESALNKMISAKMWDKAFSPTGYKTINVLNLSYCKQ